MMLFACLLMGASVVTAQTSKVSGLVIGAEDNEPVIGATVAVKGVPTLGAITDIEGKFVIENLPSSAKTLVVSYVGMTTQEVTIHPYVKVYMHSDAEILDEVMVVAYGTAKKSAFTGSAAVVKTDDIAKVQTSNAVTALTGKVAGVQLNTASGQPGQTSPSIRIRGISSINAGNDPLIILDGTPYAGDMNDINAQDIESMTVLKDAASNALYGARGANGVIMITTKKAKQDSKAIVNVDAKWGSNTRATQDYVTLDDPAHYYETYFQALNNYFINAKGNTPEQAYILANQNLTANNSLGLGYNVYNVPEGQYMIGMNGKLNPAATMGNVVKFNGEEYLLTADNWLDAAYKSSTRQEYNVSVSNANQATTFYASANLMSNEGITANSDYDRFTARLKADTQAKKWLKVGGNMSFTHYSGKSMAEDGSSNSSGNIFAAATQVAPIYPLYIRDKDGNILVDTYGNLRYDYGDKKNAGLERPVFTQSNALSSAILDTNSYEGNAAYATGYFELALARGLKFTSTNTANLTENRSTSITNPYYGSYASSNGIVSKSHTRRLAYTFQQLLNYTKSYGLNNVEAMLGHEYYVNDYYYLYGSKSNMFDPNNGELAGAVTDGSSNSYTTSYNTEGFFGRMMYNYDEKYFLSGSYRRDASSRFHPENRWGDFWSVGGAYLISKENWFDAKWVDMLKFKASYGEQGNDNIGNYRYTSVYDIVNGVGNPAAVPSTMGKKDITWEKNGNFNAGIDFELFKRRLVGTVEYFNRTTSDMLFSFPIAPSFGYTSYMANIGDMANKGFEAELTATLVRTKNLTWDVSANITAYKNTITYLPEERKSMEVDGVKGFSSGSMFYGEGISLYTFHMTRYAGVDPLTGEALYYKNVYKLDEEGNATKEVDYMEKTADHSKADYYLCGTSLPDAYGGFSTSLSFKGFDVAVDFAYQIGGQVYDGDYAAAMSSPTGNSRGSVFHEDILNAWTPENATSNIPRLQFEDKYTAASSDRFLTDASYLSLQNINVGYTLPAKAVRAMGISKLRVYAAADNVWVWSKRQGLDPRQSITGGASASYYAPIRTVSAGVNLTF